MVRRVDRVVRTPPVRPVRRPYEREDDEQPPNTPRDETLPTPPAQRDPGDHVIDEYLK